LMRALSVRPGGSGGIVLNPERITRFAF